MLEKEPKPRSPKESLQDQLLKILENNDALCMDVKEERDKLAGLLTEAIWEGELRIPGLGEEDIGFNRKP